jgi:hypothetical protein
MFCLASCLRHKDSGHNAKISQAISEHLQAYPHSTLIDLYKSFFQDEFGPGHLLHDTTAARDYFIMELETMISKGRNEAEPCGMGSNFVRVPMDIVKDGHIDKEKYFKAFLESSIEFASPDINEWRKKWNEILEVLEEMRLEIPGFYEDKARIEKMLETGKTMVHHSQLYRDHYDPHYRIMTKDIYSIQIAKGIN